MFFVFNELRPPRSTRTDTLFPYTTLCRSQATELIEISNAEQLDDARWQILLGHVRLRPDGDGATLPQLAEDVRRRLAGEAPHLIAEFDGRLLAAGYLAAHDDLYVRT